MEPWPSCGGPGGGFEDSPSPYTLPVPSPGLRVAFTSHHSGVPGEGGTCTGAPRIQLVL